MKLSALILPLFLSISAFSQNDPPISPPLDVLQIGSVEPDVYGSKCGIVGEDPELRKTIEQLIEEVEIEAIDTWLFSDNPTRKVYAVEALLRLQESGLDLTTLEKNAIRKTKQMDDEITTCTGCMMGKASVKEVLKQYELD